MGRRDGPKRWAEEMGRRDGLKSWSEKTIAKNRDGSILETRMTINICKHLEAVWRCDEKVP
jgi:hypothetical protein